MQEGVDKEAYLAIYDEAKGVFLPVPGDIGRVPVTKDGKKTYCYLPVHTHSGTGGTLHLATDPANRLEMSFVIREVSRRFKHPVSDLGIHVNG
ncbi:MAG: hypothetical protein WD896_00170, partial [Parcubacteria group bacterium]